ncbi:MAG: hypothetical protein OFPII_12420 [Osedax symbiont Rs1]|nr:MAG: hypothetical protein OFPII_12420 [Osedax symbiont Rs1]
MYSVMPVKFGLVLANIMQWSHNIFAKAHNEVAFRNQVMTKTNVLAASAEPFLDELSKIADYAEEFSNSKMISEKKYGAYLLILRKVLSSQDTR